MATRLDVKKTYKLYVGGKFPRSESGRSYAITDTRDRFLANAARASRKDVRDAVLAARSAQPGWAAATAYNRGQVLYRVAEVLEGRRAQFVDDIGALEGVTARRAQTQIDAAIDRWVWYAGWTDKFAQIDGATNPVAGPFFNLSTPGPTGVVGAVAPATSSLLGLISVVAPIIASGNTAVVIASQNRPLPAITLGEVLATSDVPAGVVNILTGSPTDLLPWLAGHQDVDALDLTGAPLELWADAARAAAASTKRVLAPAVDATWLDDDAQSPADVLATMEIKTVWHPAGT